MESTSYQSKPNGVLQPQAFARTYDPASHADAWDLVFEYDRVMHVANRNSNRGSGALASQLELPRGRIRTWVDEGGAPDVVRGLETAADHGWFADDLDVTTAWATLYAGILGGGSIDVTGRRPKWTSAPGAAADRIESALETLGVGSRTHSRDDRPDEIQPADDQSVLGRALEALNAPVGGKNTETVEPIPAWLQAAPRQARLAAVETLVLYRGQSYPEKDTISLFEQRSRAYRSSVVELIESVVDGDVSVGSRYVVISAEAARELGVGRGGPLRNALEAAD